MEQFTIKVTQKSKETFEKLAAKEGRPCPTGSGGNWSMLFEKNTELNWQKKMRPMLRKGMLGRVIAGGAQTEILSYRCLSQGAKIIGDIFNGDIQ